MLHMALKKGDYTMIGDEIKVSYNQNDGNRVIVIGINAPKDLKIVRSEVYEESVRKMALAGDEESIELLANIQHENEERRKIFNKRMAKRQYHGGRMARATKAT